jgi:hypothetical protein
LNQQKEGEDRRGGEVVVGEVYGEFRVNEYMGEERKLL